jgi:hypothetical protein
MTRQNCFRTFAYRCSSCIFIVVERGRATPANFMTNYGKKTRLSDLFKSKPLDYRISTNLSKKMQ